ncbi:alpha/beta hydrolase fold domain-containing protein [Hyphococcus lacteus]|uniref:Alpha/beta hydrolase fold domain-containing protein n=1 Tax=Hyphococcus lacteus TaxID=3143536 RepID=A0ABV3Z7Y9_9PROT
MKNKKSSSIDPEIQQFISSIMIGGDEGHVSEAMLLNTQRERAEETRKPWTEGGPPADSEDLFIPKSDGRIRIRIYRPEYLQDNCPALVYMHGGGFTLFSLDTHDRVMREYAQRSGVVVVGVDYSLSPEVKFPTALDETAVAIDWVIENSDRMGIDRNKLAMAGDSAGANLCLAVSLMFRDRSVPSPIKALVLNYGFFEMDSKTVSQKKYGGPGELLTTEELQIYWDNYVGGTIHEKNPLAFPMDADLKGLPPSYHVIPACDPLADSNLRMVEKLILAGNDVEFSVYESATHSFLEAVAISKLADEAFQVSSDWLDKKLNS